MGMRGTGSGTVSVRYGRDVCLSGHAAATVLGGRCEL